MGDGPFIAGFHAGSTPAYRENGILWFFGREEVEEKKMMIDALEKEADMTFTENGAVTYRSTDSECLDLFATIGALRHASDNNILDRFVKAYTENRDNAMKILFFARDVRGGLGERRVFRVIMNWLADEHPESVKKNIEYFAEYGRYDDILALFGTKCEKDMLAYVEKQLAKDTEALERGEEVSLLAKWLPSVNASNGDTVYAAKKTAKALGFSDAEYRKILSALRAKIKLIENNLREKNYSFDYGKQPSKALFKYRAAFIRNDGERYKEFLGKVQKGEETLHAGTLMPYELIDPYLNGFGRTNFKNMSEDEKAALNATWAALPDFGGDSNSMAIIDTSGSMYGYSKPRPASVALSLGLYFAERNKGWFRNRFIEFSARPQLIGIKGDTFVDKLEYVASFNEIANTDIEAVFNLILNAAVKNNVPQEEFPETLYLISDMEFDRCVENGGSTNFENAKRKFESFGYRLPNVVFWNVDSRNTQQPVKMNEQGVALVSGCTPRLFSMVMSGELDPYTFMMDVIGSDRYAKIAA